MTKAQELRSKNLLDIFDAIVGYEGAAAVDDWREMTFQQLCEQADALGDHYYQLISAADAEKIAKAVIDYKAADGTNSKFYVREELGECE